MSIPPEEAIEGAEKCIQDAYLYVVNNLPPSREKALVLTKLDEARLWLQELGGKS